MKLIPDVQYTIYSVPLAHILPIGSIYGYILQYTVSNQTSETSQIVPDFTIVVYNSSSCNYLYFICYYFIYWLRER